MAPGPCRSGQWLGLRNGAPGGRAFRGYQPSRALGPWALATALAALLLGPGEVRGDDPPPRLLPLVGQTRWVEVAAGDTLVDLAHRHGLGFDLLARLNPGVKVWVPVPGTPVQLPTRQILPDASLEGLVINIPEMRLYDFTVAEGVAVRSVAVGDAADPTPIGRFRVGEKALHPAWRVPASIRAKRPELPAVVPPGPDNPIGSRWMRIGSTSYGIHGTNVPWSIGRQSTHGCVRLYEPEMQELYGRIPSGTPLELVYQTVKLGRQGDRLFLEVHPDLYGLEPDRVEGTLARLERIGLAGAVDPQRLRRLIAEQRGIPVLLGEIPAPEPLRPLRLARRT